MFLARRFARLNRLLEPLSGRFFLLYYSSLNSMLQVPIQLLYNIDIITI